jgi:glutathione S-transferase
LLTNERHFSTGPAKQGGYDLLTLYHHPSSTCSAKVRIVLAEKEIPWISQVVDIFRGEQFTPDYLALNAAGVVPTLVHEDRTVRESLVICEYLEEAFAGPSLVSSNYVDRARMRVWCKDIETFMVSACVGLTFPASDRFDIATLSGSERSSYFQSHPNRRLAERKQRWIEQGFADKDARMAVLTYHKFLQKMDMQLGRAPWLAGQSYTLADAETTPYVALPDLLGLNEWWRRLPRIEDWYARVKQRPSFCAAITDAVPAQLKADMVARGAKAWPDIDAILATAEPFTGRSPWAMRAEAL